MVGVVLLIIVVLLVWLATRLSPLFGHPHLVRLVGYHAALAADRSKVVVCLGDSLTEGNAGFDYVHELASRLEPWGYTVLNAGINSELAWNVLQRVDQVVRIEPAYVVLLIGTNDARACESEWAARRYERRCKLPQTPDERFFRESYVELLDALGESPCTQTIAVTLPPLGEARGGPIDDHVERLNAIIETEARARGLSCVPLHRATIEALAIGEAKQPPAYDARRSQRLIIRSVILRYVLGWDWDRIAERHGMMLLTDMIHLDGRGGRILAGLVESEVRGLPARDC